MSILIGKVERCLRIEETRKNKAIDNGRVRLCYSNLIINIPDLESRKIPFAINICYFYRSIVFCRPSPSCKTNDSRDPLDELDPEVHGDWKLFFGDRMAVSQKLDVFVEITGSVVAAWDLHEGTDAFPIIGLSSYQLHVLIILTPFYIRVPIAIAENSSVQQRTCFSAGGEQIFFSYPRICICAQAHKQARAKRFFEYPSFDASSRSLRADWLNSIAIRWDLCVNTSQWYRKS